MRFIPTSSPWKTSFWVLVLEMGMLSFDNGTLTLLVFLFVAVFCYFDYDAAAAAFVTAWPDPLFLKWLYVGLVFTCIPGKFLTLMSYGLKLFYLAFAFFFFFFFLDAFICAHRGSTTRRIYFWILQTALVSRSNRIFSKWLIFRSNFSCLILTSSFVLT